MDDILDRVAGSMALEGFELTEDDRRRIQTLIEHPELKEIRLAAPLREYPKFEETLRSLFPEAEIRYI